MTALRRHRSTTSAAVLGTATVLPLPRSQADPEELRDAFDRYRAATACQATAAPVTPEIAEARIALTVLLVRDGWEPPPAVLEQLQRDEELLRRPLSSAS